MFSENSNSDRLGKLDDLECELKTAGAEILVKDGLISKLGIDLEDAKDNVVEFGRLIEDLRKECEVLKEKLGSQI